MDERSENKESSPPQYKYPKIISRRKFLMNTSLTIGGVVAFLGGTSALFYQAALRNKKEGKTITKRRRNLVYLGEKSELDNLTELTQFEFQTEVQDAWVKQKVNGLVYVNKNENNELLVMSPVCTHLGCTVPFASSKDQQTNPNMAFRCPCHGGMFDEFGKNIGGPPPRPLDIYQPVIQEGKVYFDYDSLKQRPS